MCSFASLIFPRLLCIFFRYRKLKLTSQTYLRTIVEYCERISFDRFHKQETPRVFVSVENRIDER